MSLGWISRRRNHVGWETSNPDLFASLHSKDTVFYVHDGKEMNPLLRIAVPLAQLIGKAPHVTFLSAGDLEREISASSLPATPRAARTCGGSSWQGSNSSHFRSD
jgi:hypothetical protein